MKLFWKSFRIALLVQLGLTLFFILGSVISGEKALGDNFRYGIYFSFLFLQFFPIVLLIVLTVLLVVGWLLQNRNVLQKATPVKTKMKFILQVILVSVVCTGGALIVMYAVGLWKFE